MPKEIAKKFFGYAANPEAMKLLNKRPSSPKLRVDNQSLISQFQKANNSIPLRSIQHDLSAAFRLQAVP